jgi:hypothetical protein
MLALNRPLDARDEGDASFRSKRQVWADIELAVVQGQGQRVISQFGGPLDQLRRGVRDGIEGIVRRVRV